MSRFISQKTKRINLNDSEYIDVVEKIDYESYLGIVGLMDLKNGIVLPAFMPLLKKVVVGWNFKDDDGIDVPCTPENISKLDAISLIDIANLLMPIYTPEKKN